MRPRSVHRVRTVAVVLVAAAVIASGCSGSGTARLGTTAGVDATARPTAAGAAAEREAATASDLCTAAVLRPRRPRVQAGGLTETSGLARSPAAPALIWAHNDSGGGPELFAIGRRGRHLGAYTLSGATATDWEDMARLPRPATDVLFVADIGDNPPSDRSAVVVYRAPEPVVASSSSRTVAGVEAITLTYGDGPRDAEALLADPVTGDLFVVSKAWDGTPAGVYRIPANVAADPPSEAVTMARVGDVTGPDGGPLDGGNQSLANLVTAGDVAPNGSIVGLRTYDRVLLYPRAPSDTVADALARTPCEAPVALEPQGEAFGFTLDGRGYLTISEGAHPRIHTFHLP